eukprot:8197245-Pyramimonas_sp.AAC.1
MWRARLVSLPAQATHTLAMSGSHTLWRGSGKGEGGQDDVLGKKEDRVRGKPKLSPGPPDKSGGYQRHH